MFQPDFQSSRPLFDVQQQQNQKEEHAPHKIVRMQKGQIRLSGDVHDGAVGVHPFSSVQRPSFQLLDQHTSREFSVVRTDLKSPAALEAAAHVIGGTALRRLLYSTHYPTFFNRLYYIGPHSSKFLQQYHCMGGDSLATAGKA